MDLSLDRENCGQCGNVCGALAEGGATECVEGECQLASENCTNGEDDNGDGFVSKQEYIEKCGKALAAGMRYLLVALLWPRAAVWSSS